MALQAIPELARLEVGLQGRDQRTLRQLISRLPDADARRTALASALRGPKMSIA